MIRIAFPLIALAATVGCTPVTAPEVSPAPGVECDASRLGSLKGKLQNEATAAEAMRLSGAKTLRWIKPGMAVTMDFRADRLSLMLSEDGKIISAACG